MLEKRLTLLAAPEETPTIGIISAFLGVSWVAVLLRCYTRVFLVKKFYPEDWVMVATLLFFTGYCASAITLSSLVTQGENKLLTLDDALVALKLVIIVESFYIWTVMILKISIGVFFLRISVERWLRASAWGCMILSTVVSIALFLFTILQCGAFDNIMEYGLKKLTKQCVADRAVAAMSYTHGAVTCFTDFVFVLMPIMILRGASMPTRDKFIAGGLLMLASASGIAAIVRFTFIESIAAPTETFFTTCAGVTIWSCIEPGIGIIAGSVICLRPLVRRQLGLISWSFGKKISYNSTNPYTLELTQDTTTLKQPREEVSPDPRDMKNSYDAEAAAEAPNWPEAVHPAAATDTIRSSDRNSNMEVLLAGRQNRSRQANDGLPLGMIRSN